MRRHFTDKHHAPPNVSARISAHVKTEIHFWKIAKSNRRYTFDCHIQKTKSNKADKMLPTKRIQFSPLW